MSCPMGFSAENQRRAAICGNHLFPVGRCFRRFQKRPAFLVVDNAQSSAAARQIEVAVVSKIHRRVGIAYGIVFYA